MPKVMLRKIYIIALQILISIAALICVDSGYADVIDSRTSGVAPLGVFFNSGFSENTASDNPFHDLEYSWDFGDTGNDYWAIEKDSVSGRSKNTDKGPVAAHVYENPGTYTVTLIVRDETGIISNYQL